MKIHDRTRIEMPISAAIERNRHMQLDPLDCVIRFKELPLRFQLVARSVAGVP
jgi:hypothetical protein